MFQYKVFRKLLKKDLVQGFYINRIKLIIFILFIVVMTIGMGNLIRNNEGNIVDLFFVCYRDIGYIENIKELNSLPIVWIFINAFVVFFIGDFVYEDLRKNSIYTLVRTKRIQEYWLSKICWIFINVFLLYVILFAVTYFIGGLFLDNSMKWTIFSNRLIKEKMVRELSPLKFTIILFIIYTSTSMSIAVLQTYFTLFIKPVHSFLLVIIIISLSIFLDNQLLIGIHSMILKHDYFDSWHGLSLIKSIVYNIGLISLLSYLGYRRIKNKDII